MEAESVLTVMHFKRQ